MRIESNTPKAMKWGVAAFIVCAIGVIAFWGGVAFIAVHFIAKFW